MSNYQRVGRVVHHCNRAAGLSLSLSLSRVAPTGPRGSASTSSPAAIRPAALLFDRGKSIRGGSVNAGGVATPHMLTGRIASPHGNYSEDRLARSSWRSSTENLSSSARFPVSRDPAAGTTLTTTTTLLSGRRRKLFFTIISPLAGRMGKAPVSNQKATQSPVIATVCK